MSRERRRPERGLLRRLVLAGSLMAARLTRIAEECKHAPEHRELVLVWEHMLAQLRASLAAEVWVTAPREIIGACDICGTTDRHLVEDTCAVCSAK